MQLIVTWKLLKNWRAKRWKLRRKRNLRTRSWHITLESLFILTDVGRDITRLKSSSGKS